MRTPCSGGWKGAYLGSRQLSYRCGRNCTRYSVGVAPGNPADFDFSALRKDQGGVEGLLQAHGFTTCSDLFLTSPHV